MAVRQRKQEAKATAEAKDGAVEPVKNDSRWRKFAVRAGMAIVMKCMLIFNLYLGHIAICSTLIVLQLLVFRELVNLRYVEAKEKHMPYFRSLQWAWYLVAAVYAHGSTWLKAPMGVDRKLVSTFTSSIIASGVISEQSLFDFVSFGLFSLVFICSVLSLRPGLYEYQITQFTWTLMIILMVVVQMKTMVHNVYNGLFWFLFPFTLVAANDTIAYFAGFFFGKKIFSCKFLALSPNKTWEGFIGGLLGSVLYAVVASPLMGRYKPFGCSYPELMRAAPDWPESCTNDHLWAVDGNLSIRYHAVVLALFVSLVAPFGGFFASAIKRASKIKDFGHLFPGHGGFMDRMDCQLVVFCFVHLYYSTFIAHPASHLPLAEVLSAASQLDVAERAILLQSLSG